MEHTRIDEGVKRGPKRKPTDRPRRTEAAIAANIKIPATLTTQEVIDRYLNDEKTSAIAVSYGISRSRLHQWLIEHSEDDWKRAQVARAVTALEEAKDQLQSAEDALSLARAREGLRSAQWELERLFSRLFGAKQELTIEVNHQVNVDIALSEEASELIHRIRKANAAVLQAETVIESIPVSVQAIDT